MASLSLTFKKCFLAFEVFQLQMMLFLTLHDAATNSRIKNKQTNKHWLALGFWTDFVKG